MERAKAALERVGLGDRLDFRPTQLSGGQKQRVAIARAIVTGPDLLLADEPTGALDSVSGRQIMELFSELNQEGMTVLMITHDAQIAGCADRMVMIKDGRLKDGEEQENGKNKKKILIGSVSGVAAAVLLTGIIVAAVQGSGKAVKVAPVSNMNSGGWSSGSEISDYGTVTTNMNQDIYYDDSLTVKEVYVKVGDTVKIGGSSGCL